MRLPLAVMLVVAALIGLYADGSGLRPAAAEQPRALLLVQQPQQPFFRDRRPQAEEPAQRAAPTPRLQLQANPAQKGTYTATDPSGQSYRVLPDPFSGWYRVEDQSGRTVYKIRPGVRGPGTYDVKP